MLPAPIPRHAPICGRYVQLVPLARQHADALYAISRHPEAARLYRYLPDEPLASLAESAGWIETRLAADDPLFFACVDVATGSILGRQALMRITPQHGVIEIGNILWGPAMAGTRLATEALYLMARYVFDELGYRRFEWKCDSRNGPSRRAALRFGFTFEGIFRQHLWVKGQNRDTAWYAMLDRDWPALRAAYERWLDPANFDAAGRQRSPLGIASAAVPVAALLCDLDGTLVDTETHTDRAIETVVARHGIAGFALPPAETRGRTWPDVAATIRERTGLSASVDELVAQLLVFWNEATADVRPVRGAPEALRAAAASGIRIAVVSSSPLAVIRRLVAGLGIADIVDAEACVGGDGVARGKPDPEGYVKAAARLGVEPGAALVLEDSRAGLLAAQAAGMRALFITACAADVAANERLATAATTDYVALPAGIWEQLAAGTLDLAGRHWP